MITISSFSSPKSALFAAATLLALPMIPTAGASEGTTIQKRILRSMDAPDGIVAGGWRVDKTASNHSPSDIDPKVGSGAVRFSGEALGGGGKGDFQIFGPLPEGLKKLTLWVHLSPDSNVKVIGFQPFDAEGEALLQKVEADWTGWQKLEFDLEDSAFEQAWRQPEQDGKIQQPLRSLNLAWFVREAGPTYLDVDGLVGEFVVDPSQVANRPFSLSVETPASAEAGAALAGSVVLQNNSNAPEKPKITYHLLANPQLEDVAVPDPIHGLNIAKGTRSWTLNAQGETIEEGSLTDGRDFTNYETGWSNDKVGELRQRIDLGTAVRPTKLKIFPTDANWIWNAEISGSMDGENFTVIPGLEAVDLHRKFSGLEVPVSSAPEVRFLQVRYFKEGEAPSRVSLPRGLEVFAGAKESDWVLPDLGGVVAEGSLEPEIAAGEFAVLPLTAVKIPGDGAYLLRVKATAGNHTEVVQKSIFTTPPPPPRSNPDESRFGLNTASMRLADRWGPYGFGWVRFENMKWAMFSPAPNDYRFDGSVGPWNVRHDDFMRIYNESGVRVLPYIFIVPEYATSAGPDVKKLRDAHPPKDPDMYRDAVFQVVARYGSKKVDESKLETPDKVSGLNLIQAVEIWNEPNLNPRSDATWGAWAAPLEEFWPFFRAGAEGARAADPDLPITSPGMAGLTLEVVEPFRTVVYPDGKRPIDFMDIINVHYYSGRQPPETATVDRNVQRHGSEEGDRTYVTDVEDLIAWRDEHGPGKPIWLTETGYDSSGSHGISERLQAARLPRVMILALAGGIDKVFMYRESGSTPSQHASSGLLRNDFSPKPSYFSVATMLRELAGMQQGPSPRLPDPDPNIWAYAWETPRGLVITAWTVEGNGVLNLGSGQCEVVDSFGGRRTVDASAIPVGDFPIYIHGAADLPAVKERRKQAVEQVKAAQEARRKLADLPVFLFDFGTTEHVGILRGFGPARNFIAVTGDTAYESELGFGIEGGKVRNDDRRWIRDALERDSVRLDANRSFTFDIPAGTYEFTISAGPVGREEALLSVEDATKVDGSSAEFTIGPKSEPIREKIRILGPSAKIKVDGPADIHWLALVAAED